MAINETHTSALELVFGKESSGNSAEERASTSSRLFVRSQIQIALDNERAKGRRLSAQEALDTFGWDVLSGLAENNVVPIIQLEDEPGRTIRERRTQLGLSVEQLAHVAKLNTELITDLESSKRAIPIRDLENIARYLSLNEYQLGQQPGAGADQSLGVRLRELIGDSSFDQTKFSASLVTGLSEAAWVIKRQIELRKKLPSQRTKGPRQLGITPSNDYNYPAFKKGQELAARTRQILDIAPDEPIENLKELVETVLSIPVIQAELPERFAGATVANGGQARGIVLNLKGPNTNVWIRRNTLAHELAHLLWDPSENLNRLLVDEFEDLNVDPFNTPRGYRDPVEVRANAFAAEFLAPQPAVKDLFNRADSHEAGLRDVIVTYGISFTAARWQVANALGISPNQLDIGRLDIQPTDDWNGRENFTADYFPIEKTPISRRGRFCSVLIEAMERGIISEDTVASHLGTDARTVHSAIPLIKALFD